MISSQNFLLLFRWKGSLWKDVWKELLGYTLAYFLVTIFYRVILSPAEVPELLSDATLMSNGTLFETTKAILPIPPLGSQEWFTRFITFFESYSKGMPLTFILGFYVSLVVNRWWSLYNSLPWPDDVALTLRQVISGWDEKSHLSEEEIESLSQDEKDKIKNHHLEEQRKVRRTIIRYCILSYILAILPNSKRLQKKYSNWKALEDTGILRPDEKDSVKEADNWWVPLQWSVEILSDALQNGLMKTMKDTHWVPMGQVTAFKNKLQSVKAYDDVSIPLVYSQVVTVAVYAYFAVALVAEQYKVGQEVNLWYPIFLSLRFLFFFGWLETARALYNPFGNDDEDFKLDELIDRHIKVSMAIVDGRGEVPTLEKDLFWDMGKHAKMLQVQDGDAGGEANPLGPGEVDVETGV